MGWEVFLRFTRLPASTPPPPPPPPAPPPPPPDPPLATLEQVLGTVALPPSPVELAVVEVIEVRAARAAACLAAFLFGAVSVAEKVCWLPGGPTWHDDLNCGVWSWPSTRLTVNKG